MQPASDGSRIFAASHAGKVAGFEALKGKLLWAKKTDLLLSGGPATDGEVVVVGSSNGELLALQAADGKELWRASLSSEVLAAPAIAGGLVLVRTVDGKLSALDMVNGKPVWFVQESVPRLSVRGTSAPVINGKQVICGFDNGKLTTYALADGSAGWDVLLDPPVGRNEIERLADINATVRTIGEDLYVVGYRGQLTAVAAESGQTLWSQDIQSYEGLAVDMDKVYVSDSLSEVVALARQTGTQLWKYELLKYRDISAPAAYQNSLVVGDFEGYVHFFDATTGTAQARVRAGGARVSAPPLVVNQMLYVQTDGGDLAAFQQFPK